jgi:penicillin G amidase
MRRFLRWTAGVAMGILLLVLLLTLALWWSLRASLAKLDGRCPLPGLLASVRIERDAFGVPTIYATNRVDATRALGFLHAQERFFQMDLSRRAGAGELADLFGTVAVSFDQAQRIHRARTRAQKALAQASPSDRAILLAYTEGVVAGLNALVVRPPEYLALRSRPAPWVPEDTFLVAYAMFGDLHDISGDHDYHEEVLRQALPPAALAFFHSHDATWSAALDGSTVTMAPIPSAAEFSTANGEGPALASASWPKVATGESPQPDDESELSSRGTKGSNNWAVDGHRSGTGSAVVANDMHLSLRVPNTWYRARLVYQDPELGTQDVTGVTLPGTPVVVSGSNRYVAWGNTFSCLDITDLVVLEFDPSNSHRYRTPSGWRETERFDEVIHVLGGTNLVLQVEETTWGPVVTRGDRRYALACAMHDPEAVNMGLLQVERARTVTQALDSAALAGAPVNNFVTGDRAGNIGYSFLGRLPQRFGFDGITPCSWADGSRGWNGWVPSTNYPRLINPSDGALWSANNRTLGSPDYYLLHPSDPDNGARARQIRDALLAANPASMEALWNIYRDDRALFLERWQKLMLSILERQAATNSAWRELQGYVTSWGVRAAPESQGYRLVRGFRAIALNLLYEPVNERIARVDRAVRIENEDAAWTMLTQKPSHLLNPRFGSYESLLDEAVSRLRADLAKRGISPSQATWGHRNHLGIGHPISKGVPWLAHLLDMPDCPVSGDSHMPKVHAPGSGVSERMLVSPGHEESGWFNMPCGQSGHFLSPFYRSEMESWIKVQPQPFLPGPKTHELKLLPATAGA